MNRVRKLTNPHKHLKRIRKLWLEDIETIKGAWWYKQLGLGPRRFLAYRLALINYILNHIDENDRFYRLGNDAICVITEMGDWWYLRGVSIRPSLLKDISGKSSGLGEKLIRAVERDAKRNKIIRISLHPGHKKLYAYYEKIGYNYSGILKRVGKVWSKEFKRKA